MSVRGLRCLLIVFGVAALAVPAEAAEPRDILVVPAPRAGVVWVVGKEVGPREKVPTERLIVRLIGGVRKKYHRLAVGDRVAKGEVLVCLDDSLANEEWKTREAGVAAALLRWAETELTRDEAVARYEALLELDRRSPNCGCSREAYRTARLTVQQWEAELTRTVQDLRLRQLEADRALLIVHAHEIRSPVDGVIVEILKKQGDTVRQLDGVLRVRIVSPKK